MEPQGLKEEMREILFEAHRESTLRKDELFDDFCYCDGFFTSLSGAIEYAKPLKFQKLELRKTIAMMKLALDTAIELLNEKQQKNEQPKGQ
ncbi:MAG: hypothetical protein WBI34_03380 [Tenuifilaceae bacterium]